MALLSRDQILDAVDLKTEEVQVPEWGGSVLVRGLNGTERDAYENGLIRMEGQSAKSNLLNMRAKLVALCLVDEKGGRLFADTDIRALGRKSASALERVYEVAARLSGLSTPEHDADEEAEGN